jgi:hypothetical protein
LDVTTVARNRGTAVPILGNGSKRRSAFVAAMRGAAAKIRADERNETTSQKKAS